MLKSILQRLSSDEITLEQAAEELDQTLRTEPQSASAALATIKVARGAGQLGEVSYSRLYQIVRRSLDSSHSTPPSRGGGHTTEEPEETVIAGSRRAQPPADATGEEATVFAAGGSGSAPADEADEALAGETDGPAGDESSPRFPEDAEARSAATDTQGDTPPSATDALEPDGDDEDDEDAPTVIARLARSRQVTSREQADSAAATDSTDEDAEAGDTNDAGTTADDVDEEDDEDYAPTFIARLARSRYGSAAGSPEPRSTPSPGPEPETSRDAPNESARVPDTPPDRASGTFAGSRRPSAGRDKGFVPPWERPVIEESEDSDAGSGSGTSQPRDPADHAAETGASSTGAGEPGAGEAPAEDGAARASGDVDLPLDDTEETVVATRPDPAADEGDETVRSTRPITGNRATGPDSGSGSDGWSTSTRTSERSWTPPGSENTPELQGLGPGSVIKDRFVLEKVLGSGGMGKVYQASDQLKVEARDRNPHVALKVLTEDFKEHPEAFIALQRESSRQQRLAHPNIATVYDFDRIGRSGTQVFITMELMEGYPLNTYIKKMVRPRGGLSPEEAIPMIAQLGSALAYAHKRDIVHSDFKPGNAFLCNDGALKVLDFGIARAVKAPVTAEDGGDGNGARGSDGDDHGEHTYFDPGQLGALTPAYASLEMLEGEPPDPRDDIYALACVAYELLTGHHPFARKSASKAKAEGLVPAPIKTLKRRQMRGLLRGLAFERDKRSPDVETFVEDIEGRLNWHKNPYVIGGALAAAIGIASIGPILDWVEQRRIDQLVAEVQTGEPVRIESVLADLDEFETAARSTITEEARDAIQSHFEARIRDAVDPAEGHYDFDRAGDELARAQDLYPDSAAIIQLGEFLESARDRRLHELNQQLIAALENDRLLADQGTTDEPAVPAVLDRILGIAADHPLLEDPRVPSAYASAAQGAINTGDLDQAEAYLQTGEELAPGDIDLLNTHARLETARANRVRSARVDELRERFDGSLAEMDTLDAFVEAEEAIVELARLAPDDSALAALSETASEIGTTRIEEDITPDGRAAAGEFVDRYGDVLEALDLHGLVVTARLSHLDEQQAASERETIVNAARDGLNDALADPAFDRAWEADLRNHLRYLEAAVPEDQTGILTEAQGAVAEVYVDRATQLREEQLYSEALALLERARGFDLDQPELEEAYAATDQAQAEFLREREEAARQARVQGLKETMLIQARAGELDAAASTFDEIESLLPVDDPFLTITAPNALGEAFEEAAQEKADADDYAAAKRIAERGQEYAPDDRGLNEARQSYTVEVNIDELERIFAEASAFDTSRAARMVDEIRTWAPARYSQLESEFIATLGDRIRELANDDRAAAERLASRAGNIFPASTALAELREEVAPRPWPDGSAGRAALAAGRLNEAEAILERGLRERPDHPEVTNLQEDLEARIAEAETAFSAFRVALDNDNLSEARRHLADARSLWVDNSDFRAAQSELSEKVASRRRQQSRVLQRSQDLEGLRAAAETSGREIVEEDWDPVPSSRPCTPRLAGYGPRARAICYDLIHDRVRGPLMVVIPEGPDHDRFAISKYEISVDDYNKYCFLSGNCPVDDDTNEDLPLTGVSIDEIRTYADWLSERTGKTYRLPDVDEWGYAAEAKGEQPPRDFNCRVTLGDQVLKGTNLVSVSVGHQNGWGLKNYIGNARELVAGESSLVARGGAYRNPHSECSLELERPHDGQGDAITGFRLVLEEVESID